MTPLLATYLCYIVITVGITLIVARKLREHGLTILTEGQEQRKPLMDASIRLLLVGFNLVTLGVISYALTVQTKVLDAAQSVEILSQKIGMIVILIAVVHFILLLVLGAIRQSLQPRREF